MKKYYINKKFDNHNSAESFWRELEDSYRKIFKKFVGQHPYYSSKGKRCDEVLLAFYVENEKQESFIENLSQIIEVYEAKITS